MIITFHLERNGDRPSSMNRLVDALMKLPLPKRFTISIEEWFEPLPHNLRARLHIPMRAIARHLGMTEKQYKRLVKDEFYPKEIVRYKGREVELPKDTMALSPEEARIIEAALYEIAGAEGIPLSNPYEGRL